MSSSGLGRRAVLSGAACSLAAASGCLGEIRNLAGRQRAQQISLSIATLPIDNDPYALRISNLLADNLEAAGIDVGIDPLDPEVFLREILINHEFDLYVAPYLGENGPNLLQSLLHSTYGEEGGWQNPFGFSNLEINEMLDEQRTLDGVDRREVINDIQAAVVREQPFTVVAFPDRIAAVRSDRFTGWPSGGLRELLSYLALEVVDDADTLRLLIRDTRATRNLNPIAVEYRTQHDITELLYEPLVRGPDRDIPWLAESVEWSSVDGLTARIAIRETTWHDDEPITAEDVAFTYQFLADTSLEEMETPVPTPRHRGRISLVQSASVVDDMTVELRFTTTASAIAREALTVPILPQHIWEEQAVPADIAGLDIVGGTTEALVWTNEEPIGSGPFRFANATADASLELERFDDHFLGRQPANVPDRYRGRPPFERIVYTVVPSYDAAIGILEEDEADATIGGLRAGVVPRIGRAADVGFSTVRSETFYHVGYNCRRAPLVDPQFRRAIARLVDRDTIVTDAFEGYATAAESPLDGTPWVMPQLRWQGESPVLPFAGQDGELDVAVARDEFRDAGYVYDGDRLVSRGES